MFLFERLFGIAIYSLLLLFFVKKILYAESFKDIKKLLIIYVFFLGVMGYFYQPYRTADLYYINGLISNRLQFFSYNEIIDFIINNKYGIYPFYYWIFGQIGNIKLLPAVTAIFFYSNVFYIIFKSAKQFNFSSRTIANLILFFMAGRTIFRGNKWHKIFVCIFNNCIMLL